MNWHTPAVAALLDFIALSIGYLVIIGVMFSDSSSNHCWNHSAATTSRQTSIQEER